jgi:predicted Zn-dependent peptidase
MRSEGSGARMGAISRSWWYDHKIKTVQEVKDAIDSVSQEQVLQVLHRFSPLKPLTIAAIGPLQRDELVGDTL